MSIPDERVEVTPELLARLSEALDAIPVATWTVDEPERVSINGHPHTIWRVTSNEDPGPRFARYGVAVVLLPDENDTPATRKRCEAIASIIPLAQPTVVRALVQRIRELESERDGWKNEAELNDGHCKAQAVVLNDQRAQLEEIAAHNPLVRERDALRREVARIEEQRRLQVKAMKAIIAELRERIRRLENDNADLDRLLFESAVHS